MAPPVAIVVWIGMILPVVPAAVVCGTSWVADMLNLMSSKFKTLWHLVQILSFKLPFDVIPLISKNFGTVTEVFASWEMFIMSRRGPSIASWELWSHSRPLRYSMINPTSCRVIIFLSESVLKLLMMYSTHLTKMFLDVSMKEQYFWFRVNVWMWRVMFSKRTMLCSSITRDYLIKLESLMKQQDRTFSHFSWRSSIPKRFAMRIISW